jgi:hypothetical protein
MFGHTDTGDVSLYAHATRSSGVMAAQNNRFCPHMLLPLSKVARAAVLSARVPIWLRLRSFPSSPCGGAIVARLNMASSLPCRHE